MALFNHIRRKKAIAYLVLAVILFFVFNFSYLSFPKLSVANLLKFPVYIVNFISQEIKAFVFFHRNWAQNSNLLRENGILKQKLVSLDELSGENKRLKELLSFKKASELPLIAARVVARDSANWANSIIIDKGRKDGVREGKLVIANLGVVGKISETAGNFSRVMLITDPDLNIGGIIQRSRQTGIVSGSLLGKCVMRYFSADSDVEAGDVVLTLGLADKYPKGMVIGKVIGLNKEHDGVSFSAAVRPEIKLSNLEEVFVMK